ncbi:hypothetical protein ACHHYP_05006 [Achlya hypogyna]|uniref:Uncharacterized protein n=1 Tax=Achlya hypogyna TaxID=1202772 RepID=A0A1V9YZ72_ACHHY|nr:hypothetical protein ACHHYP_05006 [Achlya hypogyna]
MMSSISSIFRTTRETSDATEESLGDPQMLAKQDDEVSKDVHPVRRKLSNIRRRLSLLGKSKGLDQSLQNTHEDAHVSLDDTDESDESMDETQKKLTAVLSSKSVVEIQNEAKRVCAILSGDVKKHMKILKRWDPSSTVLEEVRKAMLEANIWLSECLASPPCEADCIKEAKLSQQYHAERCLLDANAMAVAEITRLSDLAHTNTDAARFAVDP